ncbi:MAG: NAD(+) synthase [Candidatus Omnitrophica bacterium]|nr:NAD(+) synthase [Candidatus Omnitrophota bacterium]
MNESLPFQSIYRHGFARVAICIPRVRVAAPEFNAERTLDLARKAAEEGAVLALFPELGISAYSNEDLFHQDGLLNATEAALQEVLEASADISCLLLVGAPLRWEQKLFNCAIAMHQRRILGVVPKSYLPNYREFYEKRQFTSGLFASTQEMALLGQKVPFGTDLLFAAEDLPDFVVHAEICEDVWTPIPPSTYAALGGATVLTNLSASNVTIGKGAYRHDLAGGQSGKCLAAYLYAASGSGESTTDLAWDGHAMIYENDHLLAESERFCPEEQVIVADVDLGRLRQERMRMTSFNDSVHHHSDRVSQLRRVSFNIGVPNGTVELRRQVDRFPFVPGNPAEWEERCFEAYNIQVTALLKRLEATHVERLIIGVSGGLDSTQALIVACRAMDRLGLPRKNILAYTMPGFATSEHTRSNAWKLMEALGVSAEEIDIRPSCKQMLKDLKHPYAEGEPVYDVTFENVQAGERTSHLFRLANHHGGLVLGTGDLSELALGWTTYGVGDQMSHYNVNASVPKTLIQHLIRWVIQCGELKEANEVLQSILETEISPELVPGEEGDSDKPAQRTEETIGPYELQDFNLYYTTRFGFAPSKVVFLAHHAWKDRNGGTWPIGFPEEEKREYDLVTIKKWLRVFLYRFFQISQFKRSALPNAPKVGSGGSLSPRGDWRAPSDSEATAWLEELETNTPDGED